MRIRAFPILAHVAVAALLSPLEMCRMPSPHVNVFPNYLTILPGGTGAVVVEGVADDPNGSCRFASGYSLQNVPDGVSYSIGSTETPQITFDVASSAPPSSSTIHIRALGSGCTGFISLRVPPLAVTATAPPIAIDAGVEYAVAALADGTTWTWGSGRPADLGLEARRRGGSLPTMVPNLRNIRSVAAGKGHALALTWPGDVWGWGENNRGQVGDRASLGDAVDIPVQVPGVTDVQTIAAGSYHSLAVDASGAVWTWGDLAAPTRVPNLPPIRAVAAGRFESFAVDLSGAVWRWTVDLSGQPHQISGLRAIDAVSARGTGFITVDRDGIAWVQGENTLLIPELSFPTPIEGKRIEVPLVASSSLGHHNAAVTTRLGAVWEWGRLDDAHHSFTPIQVALPPARAVAVSSHRLALLDCGALWSWGRNDYGQLGDGATGSRLYPMPVLGIGDDSNCARVGLRVMVTGAPATIDAISVDPGPVETNHPELDFIATYDRGTTATLRARPELVYARSGGGHSRATFERWALDCAGTDPVTTIVLDRSRRCAVVYRTGAAPPPPPPPPLPPPPPPVGFTLTVVIDAPTGSPALVVGSMSGNTINCLATGGATSVCSQTFPPGTTTQVRPGSVEGSQFDQWVSGCDSISGANRCTVVLNGGGRIVVARFLK